MVVVNLAATSCVDPAVLDQKIVGNPQSVMSHLEPSPSKGEQSQ